MVRHRFHRNGSHHGPEQSVPTEGFSPNFNSKERREIPSATPGIYRLGDCAGSLYASCSLISDACVVVRAKAMRPLPGSIRPAIAPMSPRAAAILIAETNPLLNA